MASVFANGFKGATDIIPHIWMTVSLDVEGQFHERSFESKLVLIQPFQNVR